MGAHVFGSVGCWIELVGVFSSFPSPPFYYLNDLFFSFFPFLFFSICLCLGGLGDKGMSFCIMSTRY